MLNDNYYFITNIDKKYHFYYFKNMKKLNISELFKKAKLKVTPQRTAIINTISRYGHIEMDQLILELSNMMPNLSVATIYKNINTLLKYKIIKEVLFPNKKKMYELNCDTHIHLVCKGCGKITDVNVDREAIKERFSDITNVDFEDFLVNLFYLCDKCKNKNI